MPLRDHFCGTLRQRRHWESFLSAWTFHIIRQVNTVLPACYRGVPRVHFGASFKTDPPAQDIVEVRFHDFKPGAPPFAVVELVSPGNKDSQEHRRDFAVKCAAYLQRRASVVIVDIVTERHDSLHVELMELLGRAEAAPWPEGQDLYAVAYRITNENNVGRLSLWTHALEMGRPLPTLPLSLASNLAVPLELEASYEETCRTLRIS